MMDRDIHSDIRTTGKSLKILIIEDNSADAKLVQDVLRRDVPEEFFHFEIAADISAGMELLKGGQFNAVLLDLSLPGTEGGLSGFLRVYRQSPNVPFILLTGDRNETVGTQAVQQGAQDYLPKDELQGRLLYRMIRYSIERNKTRMQLLDLSLTDDLTGLYNRRGFLLLAEQQMKLAHRSQKGLLLFMFDVDGFKRINDTLGHAKGDLALRSVAEILKDTFRGSDIVGRLGGDEFSVVAIEANSKCQDVLVKRLRSNIKAFNNKEKKYQISLSYGVAHFDSKSTIFVEQLLTQADQALYQEKQQKKKDEKR